MLYIIQQSNNNLYKIGISKDPAKRVRQLQTGNGSKLKLVKTFSVTNEKTLEKRLHSMFWQSKTKGEWFLLCEETLNFLIEFISKHCTERI